MPRPVPLPADGKPAPAEVEPGTAFVGNIELDVGKPPAAPPAPATPCCELMSTSFMPGATSGCTVLTEPEESSWVSTAARSAARLFCT